MSFKLATLNVHMWCDAECRDNVHRITGLVQKHKPDILCVQETYIEEQGKFELSSGYENAAFLSLGGGLSILTNKDSKHIIKPFMNGKSATQSVRFTTAEVHLNGKSSNPFYLTCLHLDYRIEPRRLSEIETIRKRLGKLFDEEKQQIWCGDFNALTEEDYSKERWEEITKVRAKNSWELPKTELTSKVKSYGFVDTWVQCGSPEPIETCRFDTRIDYVYANNSLMDNHPLIKVEHVKDSASDHNMVIAEFKI